MKTRIYGQDFLCFDVDSLGKPYFSKRKSLKEKPNLKKTGCLF